MKILHIITSLHPDGAQQMLRRLVFGSEGRMEHVILSLAPRVGLSEVFEEGGVKVVHLNLGKFANPFAVAKKISILVEEIRPTIIQSWLYHANLVAALVVRKMTSSQVPLLWGIRSGYFGFKLQAARTALVIFASKFLTHLPKRIVINSLVSLEQHVRIGYPRDLMHYLPNGFDAERFSPNPVTRNTMRDRLGFAPDDVVVEICGRDDFTKDYPTFIRAFARAARENPRLKALLIGRGVDTSEQILEEISRLGIKERVVIVGYAEKTEEYYVAADFGCSSSVSEGFPNVVAEAMLCGLPMVVTDVGMSKELVVPYGHVVPPGDADGLGDALIKMGSLPLDARVDLGLMGRKHIADTYSISSVIRQFEELYAMVSKE
jgi:glycosyltransferase involved in cell wall biosynthesis